MTTETIGLDKLNLLAGQTIKVRAEESSGAFSNVTLIGVIWGQSVVLTVSESGGFPEVKEGQSLMFRIETPEGIAFFSAKVLVITDMPVFMVFVDFPNSAGFKRLRTSPRAKTTTPVLLSNESTGIQKGVAGQITDISIGGAGIIAFEALGDVGDEVIVKGKFRCGTIKRLISVRSVIRNMKALDSQKFTYGIEFRENQDESLLVLYGFVFQVMTQSSLQNVP